MMPPFRFLLFIFLLALIGAVPVQAQKLVRGVVQDAATGTALPTAQIQVAGTMQGTMTNADGVFELYLDRLPATLQVRYIGYTSAQLEVTIDTPLNVTIALPPTTYTLDTVEVTDEDPAVNIMRRVIAKKQEWRAGLKAYRAEAYTRFMLYRRDDLVHMRETISEAYWKPDGGPREVVIAKRRKPPRAKNFRFAGPSHVPNFYDDDVDLFGFTFMGPTHPDALEAYTFRMGENQMLDDRLVYEIYLSPRTALNATFAGRLLILADEYVILEAHLRPNWFALRPPPILSWQVSYAQQFAPTPEHYWLPVDLRLQGQVTFGRTGVSYAPARFEQLSRLTLHVPNVPVPDSLFANSRRIYELPFSEARTHLFRWNPGMVPLTARETASIDNIHPRLTLRAAFWPTGLLSQYAALRLEEEPPAGPTKRERGRTILSSILGWYNRVDGLHLGAQRVLDLNPNLLAEVGVGYALAREAPTARATLTYTTGVPNGTETPSVRGFLQAGYARDARPRYHSATYSRAFNTLPTYLGYADYFDYYENERAFVGAGLRLDALRTVLSVRGQAEHHRALTNQTDFEGWILGDGQRDNPAIPEGKFRSVTARLHIGDPPDSAIRPGARSLWMEVEHSPKEVLNNAFSFTRYTAELRWDAPTFFRRRTWPNALSVLVRAGAVRGDAPPQRFGVLDVSIGAFKPFGAFKTRRGLPYEGSSHLGLFWTHDFSTVPFEWLGLWTLAERGIGLSMHGGHGRTWTSDPARAALTYAPNVPDRFHHELGISLTHLFHFPIQVDFTWRLDQPGFFVGLGWMKRL